MSAAHHESVGLMHPAYFVGRNELLEWLNSTLQLKLTRVEETASGAVACQILDLLFPNTVQISRVNWGAHAEWEFVQNYKILQQAFDKLKCPKRVDVDKLIKARHQDNLEFLQWLKKFFDDNVSPAQIAQYDAKQRRAMGKGTAKYMNTTTTSTRTVVKSPPRQQSAAVAAAPPTIQSAAPLTTTAPVDDAGNLRMEVHELKRQLQELARTHEEALQRIQRQLLQAEEETNFYFAKLSQIEEVVKNKEFTESNGLSGVLDRLGNILLE